MAGLFITFEGGDATGKTTQVNLLAEYLFAHNHKYIITREPGGTELAEAIRKIILQPDRTMNSRTELLLYLAARAEHVERLIKPALAEGKIVICDRFADSTLAYQGIARALGLQTVEDLNEFATEGLQPDITFLLRTSAATRKQRGAERGTSDRLEAENEAFKERVNRGFVEVQRRYPERIKLIEAEGTPAAIHGEILGYLRDYLI